MKKQILLLIFALFPSCIFALNDVSVFFSMSTLQQRYLDSGGGLYREESSPKAGIALSNCNLFFCKEHFGIFESLNFLFGDGITAESSIGIAAGTKLSPKICIQGAPAFHLYSRFSTEDNSPVMDARIGLSHYFQAKIAVWKYISAAAGVAVSTDFYRLELSKSDDIWYYLQYKRFLNVSFSGFLGLSIHFGGL